MHPDAYNRTSCQTRQEQEPDYHKLSDCKIGNIVIVGANIYRLVSAPSDKQPMLIKMQYSRGGFVNLTQNIEFSAWNAAAKVIE